MKPINIPGYEMYHVSEDGVVINTRTSRVLKTDLTNSGYKRVTLSVGGNVLRITVHRLVALSYVEGFKEGLCVNHIDGNKLNNKNLEWVTSSQNRLHAFKHKLCKRPNSKLSDNTVNVVCTLISQQVPYKIIRDVCKIPKHIYKDIHSRRYYKDISDNYIW